MAKENKENEMVVKELYYSLEAKKIDTENHRVKFIISSNKIDRHGDIVSMDAIAASIKQFTTNPVFLACHLHRSENGNPTVIGSWDVTSFKQKKTICEMDAVFATTTLAEEYWKLYSECHMRAVSIGFRVLAYETKRENDRTIYIYTEIELLEISAVAVPANRQALAKLKELGFENIENKDLLSNWLEEFKQEVLGELAEIKAGLPDIDSHQDTEKLDDPFGIGKNHKSADQENGKIKSDTVKNVVNELLNKK